MYTPTKLHAYYVLPATVKLSCQSLFFASPQLLIYIQCQIYIRLQNLDNKIVFDIYCCCFLHIHWFLSVNVRTDDAVMMSEHVSSRTAATGRYLSRQKAGSQATSNAVSFRCPTTRVASCRLLCVAAGDSFINKRPPSGCPRTHLNRQRLVALN